MYQFTALYPWARSRMRKEKITACVDYRSTVTAYTSNTAACKFYARPASTYFGEQGSTGRPSSDCGYGYYSAAFIPGMPTSDECGLWYVNNKATTSRDKRYASVTKSMNSVSCSVSQSVQTVVVRQLWLSIPKCLLAARHSLKATLNKHRSAYFTLIHASILVYVALLYL